MHPKLIRSSGTGPDSTDGNVHLVEIKAGKMKLKKQMVYPDERKGLIYLYQSENSLMRFCWRHRTTESVEISLVIVPGDYEYVKVPQCTTGRVYLLRMKSLNEKYFFWLQEPRNDKDEENCKRINELLNNPPMITSAITPTTDTPITPSTNTSTAGYNTPQNSSIPAVVPNAPKLARTGLPSAAAISTAQQTVELSETSKHLFSSPDDLPQVDGNTQNATLDSPQFQQESGQLGPVASEQSVNKEAVAAAAQQEKSSSENKMNKGRKKKKIDIDEVD